MSYQDELRAMSSLIRAWEASHEAPLGNSSLKRLNTEELRHERMLRKIRAASDDGCKRTPKRTSR